MGGDCEVRLCKECYKRKLSLEMALHMPVIDRIVQAVVGALGGRVEAVRPDEYTRDHAACENCPVELKRLGHDPCVEMLIFDYDIEPLLPGRNGIRRLFSSLVGHDAVTEDGNVIAMIEVRVNNWLAKVDDELEAEERRAAWRSALEEVDV